MYKFSNLSYIIMYNNIYLHTYIVLYMGDFRYLQLLHNSTLMSTYNYNDLSNSRVKIVPHSRELSGDRVSCSC